MKFWIIAALLIPVCRERLDKKWKEETDRSIAANLMPIYYPRRPFEIVSDDKGQVAMHYGGMEGWMVLVISTTTPRYSVQGATECYTTEVREIKP